MITGQELWNGNRERWSNLTRWDPQENLISCAWTRRADYHRRCRDDERDGTRRGLPCVRLTSPGQLCRFVRYLGD